MATTLIISPLFPLEGATVTLTISGSDQDTFVFEVTAVPSGSTVVLGFVTKALAGTQSTVPLSNAQTVVDADLIGASFVPDVAGEYSITVYEFREAVGFAAGHDTDPVADSRFDLIATTEFNESAGVVVGENRDLPIVGQSADAVTLRVQIVGDTVRAASLVNATTERAAAAALQKSVLDDVALLVGVTASALGTDIVAAVNDLRLSYEAHRVQIAAPAVHDNVDDVNTAGAKPATDVGGAIIMLNELRDTFVSHMTDSSSAATPWHESSDDRFDDLENLPESAGAVDLPSATVLLADLRAKYTRHLAAAITPSVDPEVHTTPDTANGLAIATTVLDDAIVSFLDAVTAQAVTAPANEPQGTTDLDHRYGFTAP